MEMVDITDLKSVAIKGVLVQVQQEAPLLFVFFFVCRSTTTPIMVVIINGNALVVFLL